MNKQLWPITQSILLRQFQEEKRKILMELNRWFWTTVVEFFEKQEKKKKSLKGVFSYSPWGIFFYGRKSYFKDTIGFFPHTLEIDILDFKKGMKAKEFQKKFLTGWKKLDF